MKLQQNHIWNATNFLALPSVASHSRSQCMSQTTTADRTHEVHSQSHVLPLLFLASFVTLYFELVVIRYLSTEIRIFAYLKNLTLIASFFGIGLGMILGQ